MLCIISILIIFHSSLIPMLISLVHPYNYMILISVDENFALSLHSMHVIFLAYSRIMLRLFSKNKKRFSFDVSCLTASEKCITSRRKFERRRKNKYTLCSLNFLKLFRKKNFFLLDIFFLIIFSI